MILQFKKSVHFLLQLFFPVFKNLLPYDVYAYLSVGAANTVLNITLFAFFYHFILPQPGIRIHGSLITSYTIGLLIAFSITVPAGFWLNKHFAFEKNGTTYDRSAKQFRKYFLVVLQGLGSDYLILKCMVVSFHLQPTIAKIISTMIVLTFNYFLQKNFTFRTQKNIDLY